MDDAESYRIEIDNQSNFSSPNRSSDQTGTTYTMSPAVGNNTFYWRVRAVNSEGNGPWSAVRVFTVDIDAPPVPVLVSPAHASSTTETMPTFTWEASTNANGYEISVTGTNPPSTTNGSGSQTRFIPSASLFIGVYSWRVRARDAAGNFSAWSAPFSLNIVSTDDAAPVLNNYSAHTVTLSWARISGAGQYEIDVDDSPSFTSPLVHEATVPGSTLSITTPSLSNGTYYWRVRARRSGIWSPWSPVITFRVSAP